MEWLKSFMSGYQKVDAINKEDNLSYQDVRNDLNTILHFQEIEMKTRKMVTEIKEYFQRFAKEDDEESIPNKEQVVKKARHYGEKMAEYSEIFYDDYSIICIDPDKIEAKITMLQERVDRFRLHARYVLVLGVLLLSCIGGFTAVQIYGLRAYTYIGLGVAGGFTVGVLVFSFIYFGYLAQKKDHLSRWKDLQEKMSKVPAIKEEIVKKKPITRALSKLLQREIMEDQIIFPSEDILKSCNEYLEQ